MRDREKNDYCCGCQVYVNKRPPPPVEEKQKPVEVVETSGKGISAGNGAIIDACIQRYAKELLETTSLEHALKCVEIIERLAAVFKELR